MRRTVVSLVMSVVVLVAAPSIAAAAHHKRHHARHHRAHRTHHRSQSVRHRHFGKADPTQSGGQQAGTVTSFANGILTITLNDGSTVSGAVTDQTELDCMAPETTVQSEDGDGGDSNSGPGSGGDDNNSGDTGDDNGGGDDDGGMCTTASLTPGTPVAAARLEISGSGNNWDQVELVTSSSNSTDNDD
jgi:hypothetical protein